MYRVQNWLGQNMQATIGNDGGEIMYATSQARELVFGNGGNDWIFGNWGTDIIDGGTDQDHLFGASGNDILSGGTGDDRLYGEADNDFLNGGQGADHLYGGTGKDILTGGTGYDTFHFALGDSWAKSQEADHITDFNVRYDQLDASNYVATHETLGSTIRVASIETAKTLGNASAQQGYGSAVFNSSNGHETYVVWDDNGDGYMESGVILDNGGHMNTDTMANHSYGSLFV